MPVLPVGAAHQERGSLTLARVLNQRRCRIEDLDHVLTVSLVKWDAERGRPERDVAGSRLEVMRVLVVEVVLADIDDGQLPERGHVHALVEEALAECTLAKEAHRNL